MKQRFKRLLKKKGLTLVEILVVLVVSTILIGIALGMLTPVKRLMNTLKSNAHMDALTDTVNEYIRGSLQNAEAVNIIMYPDSINTDYWGNSDDHAYIDAADNTIKAAWKNFSEKYKASDGYKLKAIGIMQNYNNDFRLYDFGDVTNINYTWGGSLAAPIVLNSSAEGPLTAGQTFLSLLDFRDGGGRDRTWESPPRSGLDGNEFGWFNVFNDAFYSNGASSDTNYSIQVAFEAVGSELDDGSTNLNYLTVNTQMFKRIGNKYNGDDLTYEPANQVRSMSFKTLGGNTSLSTVSGTINKVETVDGGKQIVSVANDNGKTYNENVIMLYVVRDFDALLTSTP